jgi:putative tricarboxylic transport membrane protein
MRKYDLWSSLALFLLGAVICYESLHLGLGTWRIPGPGFLPFWTGIFLVSLSISIFILALIKGEGTSPGPGKFFPRADSCKIVCLVLISLIIYNLIWTTVGFSLSTLLFLGFLFRVVGKRRWRVVISGAVLTSFAAYMLFEVLLKSQLPTGILGF